MFFSKARLYRMFKKPVRFHNLRIQNRTYRTIKQPIKIHHHSNQKIASVFSIITKEKCRILLFFSEQKNHIVTINFLTLDNNQCIT